MQSSKERVLNMYPRAELRLSPRPASGTGPYFITSPLSQQSAGGRVSNYCTSEQDAWDDAASRLPTAPIEPASGDVVLPMAKPTEAEVEEAISLLQDDFRASQLAGLLAYRREYLAALTSLATAERQRDEARGQVEGMVESEMQAYEWSKAAKELSAELTAAQQSAESWRKRAEAMAAPDKLIYQREGFYSRYASGDMFIICGPNDSLIHAEGKTEGEAWERFAEKPSIEKEHA